MNYGKFYISLTFVKPKLVVPTKALSLNSANYVIVSTIEFAKDEEISCFVN
jgi:hypothetical protein